ncbi:N-acetyltransferase [Streptomyces ipomoeae]|jgi:RimJ/RimL family protein N-acetyltransferase|uniref:N-acetyltransferase n=1 Tax=Streptomyces ipomoeae TaxID=103232 RepID=A0AAE8VVB0_9ACTN|nr:GNAT family N-acetyltransferase [Streptomyces ipomoeae]MDX2825397.1 GNAT family N-acetyltransferase [Streptomyces ipomoeae]MDX2878675.1 GNAT family N-acetyltransferase [Streptomyces ipomoeae]TQE21504.1 N-acetyltransferase [Streptomyces ipomoeae]
MGGEQVLQAVEHSIARLRTVVDQDWEGTKAGRLEWNCRRTAEHIASDLIAYAGQLAGRATTAYVPFRIDTQECDGNADLLHVIETTGALLAATIRATPRDVRAFHPHPFRWADREGFAAMGIIEVLVHTHDIVEGLGLPPYEPPAELCESVLARLFPDVRPGDDPWVTLLWATGRCDLPGRAPVTEWRWHNPLHIPAERIVLQGLHPAAAADLAAGGTGGLDWIVGGPIEGTRIGAGMLFKAYEEGVHRPEWGMFALVRKEDGLAVGALGYHSAPDEEGRVEIGYDLVEGARGRGYMTEALCALADWARERSRERGDVRSLFAVVDKVNTASQGVVSRAGFVKVSDDWGVGEHGGQFAYELRLRA